MLTHNGVGSHACMGTQHFGKPLTVPVVSIEEKEMIRMFATHFTDPIEKSAV